MSVRLITPWGIKPFDEIVGGLPSQAFNVVETENNQVGLLALGHFLIEGLTNGEKCTFITAESPLSFLESFEVMKFDFYKYLKSEQFILLEVKPNITQEVGFSQNYDGLAREIDRLANGPAHRLAIHQMDNLFNLQSQMLINSCTLKLVSALRNSPSTILGQFVNFGDSTYASVRIACLKAMVGYYSIKGPLKDQYELRVERIPSFEHIESHFHMNFTLGKGFVTAKPDAEAASDSATATGRGHGKVA
jgi:KaiC/GvpD/RAD55 family RecA-like ATPase